MTILTRRFTDAVDYARIAHAPQVRKGSGIPYIYHLLGVASLVLEYRGNEDQAIAGLLHDVLEDCGDGHRAMIRAQFGDAVANIVESCTDGTVESKAHAERTGSARDHWRERKLAYLDHLRKVPESTLLVSGCDKLHNARAILGDLSNKDVGDSVFERFTAKREDTLAYYESLAEIFTARDAPMASAFDDTVAQIHSRAKASVRKPLS